MKPIERAALLRTIVSNTDVQEIWTRVKSHGTQSLTIDTIRILCESHERLRMELAGAESMLDSTYRKIDHGCTDANCELCDK